VDAEGRRRRVNVLAEPLAFNRTFQAGYPSTWNVQPLTQVFKGKGLDSDCNNYRPIQVQ
jgi:hypothetical protein